MTKHERIILDKLIENPMLSQSELADMLNLTRSSVSVYISHLMQTGHIRGRGYVIENQETLFVIGTASIDHRTVMDESIILSPEVTTSLDDYDLIVNYGGIAKNLSDNFHRMGHSVSCICAVGSDVQGQELLEECRQTGIDVSDSLVVPAAKSSTYLEIRSLDMKRILLRTANMKLQRQITPEFLLAKHHKLQHARAIIAEDSLSIDTLRHISSNYSPSLLICAKPKRVSKYAPFLNQFNGLVSSLEIAGIILGEQDPIPTDDRSVFNAVTRLSVRVNGPILLCYGNSDIAYFDNHHVTLCSYSSPLYNAALYAHYRDTVAAGFFHCLFDGIEGDDLLKYVCACREIVAQSSTTVNPYICPELINSVIESKQFSIRHSSMY